MATTTTRAWVETLIAPHSAALEEFLQRIEDRPTAPPAAASDLPQSTHVPSENAASRRSASSRSGDASPRRSASTSGCSARAVLRAQYSLRDDGRSSLREGGRSSLREDGRSSLREDGRSSLRESERAPGTRPLFRDDVRPPPPPPRALHALPTSSALWEVLVFVSRRFACARIFLTQPGPVRRVHAQT